MKDTGLKEKKEILGLRESAGFLGISIDSLKYAGEEGYLDIKKRKIRIQDLEMFKTKMDTNPDFKEELLDHSYINYFDLAKELNLPVSAVAEAIEIEILIPDRMRKVSGSTTISYFLVKEVKGIKKDQDLINRIAIQELMGSERAAKYVSMSLWKFRKLVKEGYIKVKKEIKLYRGKAYLFKREELDLLKKDESVIAQELKKKEIYNKKIGKEKAKITRVKNLELLDSYQAEKNFRLSQKDQMSEPLNRIYELAVYMVLLDKYAVEDSQLFKLKDNALLLLIKKFGELLKLRYMKGDDLVHYCHECIENAKELRDDMNGEGPFWMYIDKPCPKCKVIKDYYSLLHIKIVFISDISFTFNVPYPIAQKWGIKINNLPKIGRENYRDKKYKMNKLQKKIWPKEEVVQKIEENIEWLKNYQAN